MCACGGGERKLRSFAFDLGCATRDLLCLFPFPPARHNLRAGSQLFLWCLHVSVIVSQIAVAQRLGGILFPVKGWGEIWSFRTLRNTRRFFLSSQGDQELIQTITPFFMPLNRPNARDKPG